MALTDDLIVLSNFNSSLVNQVGTDFTNSGCTYNTSTPILGSASLVGDGIDNRVYIPDETALDFTGAFGIGLWVRPSSTATGWEVPISKYATSKREFVCQYNRTFPRLDFYIFDESANAYRGRQWTTPNIGDDDKHLLFFLHDGAGNITIYSDNVQVDNNSDNSGVFTSIEHLDAPFETLGNTNLGWYTESDADALIIRSGSVFSSAEMTEYWNGGDGIELSIPTGFPFFFGGGHYGG